MKVVPKPQRCAIYTRKSTEHNLDLEFNSLDAQREACEAYIKSQAHEGWWLIPDRYDDGGLSGASLGRPALQNLLADVRAGKITVVVVYKVDRLTRSLADFAKLVELFDQYGVSFVSITQSFNTTSSMGRLTLNVLLSLTIGAKCPRSGSIAERFLGCFEGEKVRRLIVISPYWDEDLASLNSGEEESAAQSNAFNLGDETADAEGAIEGGIDFNKTPAPPAPSVECVDELATVRMAKQRRANREQLIAAVDDLADIVAGKAASKGLRCVDLLRLRAMLMILATAAWDGASPPKNSLQVLPPAGDTEAAWPRLFGKVLFAYFGGRKAIQTLVLDGFYDQIPDDILECWASCIWAIQASLAVAARVPRISAATFTRARKLARLDLSRGRVAPGGDARCAHRACARRPKLAVRQQTEFGP
jgi:Resolvase, N terminal domain